MKHALLPMALLGLLLVAPFAFAQEDQPPTNESQDAWVKDCPPDMMCAYGGSAEDVDCSASENSTREECQSACNDCKVISAPADSPTYNGSCDGEVCAYGNESCIECSGPPADERSDNCMDGQQEGEICRGADCENCRTLDGGSDTEGAPVSDKVQSEGASKQVPGFAAGIALAAMAVAVLAVARR